MNTPKTPPFDQSRAPLTVDGDATTVWATNRFGEMLLVCLTTWGPPDSTEDGMRARDLAQACDWKGLDAMGFKQDRQGRWVKDNRPDEVTGS